MENKPGIKTTEFWLTMLANVGSLAATLGGVLPAKAAAVAVTVSTGAYAIARGVAKLGALIGLR